MSLTPILALAFTALASALAVPQGTFPQPFASNTSIGYFTGRASAAGSDLGPVPSSTNSDLDGCGIRTSNGIIQTMYCIPLICSAISIGQTSTGSCTFTLFADSETCDVLGSGDSWGYNKHQIIIPNGEEQICIGTGVLDGGRFDKASGVWACG